MPIQGFQIVIKSAELKEHLLKRSEYHKVRAEEKTAKLPKLKESLETLSNVNPANAVSQMSKGGYAFSANDPIENLEQDIRDHQNKVLVFSFFATHLFDDDYILGDADLRKLEITK